ncbi:SGNH/GDSL hydrolase family protein [Isoptericola haloaureus]|uniref:SGNH/GDSL hydrolase family protein n=1 Tax=Isoptericola haloaureus TaxID=1542902 RepID=A0ABU7ZAV6_9MICO
MNASRRARRGPTAWVAALAVGLATLVSAPAATAAPPPDEYVALGDSYAAGSGILPLDPSAPPRCLRATRNYPKLVAGALGADLTDVTCGGAETADLYDRQYRRVPAQLDAVTRKTDLVTVTIGGNDNDVFSGAILACGSLGGLTRGYGSPCEHVYGDYFVDRVEQRTYPAVRQALVDVQRRAPRADVVVVGYPWLLPPQDGCYPELPFAQGDVPYLRDLQATLNGVIERAARETGAVFVDLSVVSEGRDACSGAGTRWVEPLLDGSGVVPLHPNARGEAGMADAVLATLGS